MNKKIVGIFVCTLLITMILPVAGSVNEQEKIACPNGLQEREYGDAPEGDGAIAYPSLGVTGAFPTCKSCGPGMWVEHNNFGAWFGPGFEFEPDGNGGLCPQCFPPYDMDEGYMDNDAGLIIPEPFTIDNTITVVPFPGFAGTPLGVPGQTAVWGVDIDIDTHNHMPSEWAGYFNLIIDWNQNGKWGDAGEHVVVNFWPIPNPFDGPISMLAPPNFAIGPNPGYVWARFTISEKPVPGNWDGAEGFEDGESEDYLLWVYEEQPPVPSVACRGSISWQGMEGAKARGTKTGTFEVGNDGDPGSYLNWQITSWPTWGTWTFNPSSGTGLAEGSWVTVTATCIPPSTPNFQGSGNIVVCNSDDATDCCNIPVTISTARERGIDTPLIRFLQNYPIIYQILKNIFGF